MSKLTKAMVSVGLVLGAVLIAGILIKTSPKAKKTRPAKMAPLVQTILLQPVDEVVTLRLTGTVTTSEEIKLRSRVSGEIVSISPEFVEGGRFQKGTEIVKIDPVDYELALSEAQARLEKARFEYKQELGRQDVAKREWELLNPGDASELETELALRKPHLAASEAALKSAEATVEKATLNLSRTSVSVPFNAVVLERNANIGSQAAVQDVLAVLAGTDACRIIVSIPIDNLRWVMVPGSSVRVFSNSGDEREGTVVKLLGDLEEKGRMARLLVDVADPFCLRSENMDKKPLLFGEYVRVEIAGRTLPSVYKIPRKALREDSTVWILTGEEKLEFRDVNVLWRDPEQVIIGECFHDGERLITSDLTIPMDGMDLNTENGDSKRPKEKSDL